MIDSNHTFYFKLLGNFVSNKFLLGLFVYPIDKMVPVEKIELIGKGAYGRVYKAKCQDRIVAAKIIASSYMVEEVITIMKRLGTISNYIVQLHKCYKQRNKIWVRRKILFTNLQEFISKINYILACSFFRS